MSELSMPSVATPAKAPLTWRQWLMRISAVATIVAVVYLPVWQITIALASSAGLEDTLAVGYVVSLVVACVLALVAGLLTRHEDPGHGIMRIPHGPWSLISMGLATLFVPSVMFATGNMLNNTLMIWGINGEQPIAQLLSEVFGNFTIGTAVGGLVAAVIALFRKDRSLALVMPIAAGLLVIGFIIGEGIG